MKTQLIPNEDYYFNKNGLMVFTMAYHLKRGYCCKSGCKHCPYGNAPSDEKKNELKSNLKHKNG